MSQRKLAVTSRQNAPWRLYEGAITGVSGLGLRIEDIGKLQTEVDLWLDHLAARRLWPRTMKNYRDAAEQLEQFLMASGMPIEVEHITREHLEAFVRYLLQRNTASTAATRYRALQQLFK